MTGMQKAAAGMGLATTASFVFVVRAALTGDPRDVVDGAILAIVFSVLFAAVTARAIYEAKRARARELARETSRRTGIPV